MRDEQINEIKIPLTSTALPEKKQRKLSVLLEFENILTVDPLLDLRAYFSATAQNEMDTRKRKAPSNTLKNDDPHSFQKNI